MDLSTQYEKLLRYCYMKTEDRYLAEDIVQETYLRFWNNHSYKDTGKELAYLYTIARNLCMDEFRKKQADDIDEHEDVCISRSLEPENNFLEKIERLEIELAMQKLPEQLREIVTLRYINDLSAAQIGKIMNLSRFSVQRRIKEGLSILKKELMKGGRT